MKNNDTKKESSVKDEKLTTKEFKFSKPSVIMKRIIGLVVLLVIFFNILGYFLSFLSNEKKFEYIKKEHLIGVLSTAINNGGDLRSIKNIHKNFYPTGRELIDLFKQNTNKYYKSTIPLSYVLEDMRSNLFLNSKAGLVKKEKLESIINKYNHTNPFEILLPVQKDLFDDVRLKLGDNYSDVDIEINKIVSELSEKNKLVNKYLSDSTKSFWISIFALFLSLVIGIYQIYLAKKPKNNEYDFLKGI